MDPQNYTDLSEKFMKALYALHQSFFRQTATPIPANHFLVLLLLQNEGPSNITRMGQRVRVAGSAEIGGLPGDINDAALRTLYKVLADWFPGAARLSSGVQVWKGARPMLPDGPPIVGASGIPSLWLNLGHGSSGWALSCGSARVLADQIAGRAPEIDTEGLDVRRLAG